MTRISAFLLHLVALPSAMGRDPTRDRRTAALLGGFVADAAAMPLHWIYDTSLIADILRNTSRSATPEFLPHSYVQYYDYAPGLWTPFGEQMEVYARSLARKQRVDPVDIAAAYEAYYSAPANTSRSFRSYYDNATKGFLENVRAGRTFPHTGNGDTETNAVAHVLPVVAMRAGRPHFLRDAELAIRVVQDNDDAVAFGMTFARILEAVILGSSIEDAIETVAALLGGKGTGNRNDRFFSHGLKKMKQWAARPPFDVTLELGQACDFPFHVFTAPQLLLHGVSTTRSANANANANANGTGAAGKVLTSTYVDAIRETIKIGGENANRGSFIGSILAAAAGSADAAIPADWQNRTTRYSIVKALAEAIVDGGHTSGDASTTFNSFGRTRARSRSRGREVQRERRSASATASAAAPRLGNSPGCIAHGNSTTSNATRPPTHPDDLKALRAIYASTGGATTWIRNGCWDNDSVPVCWWDQVLCNTTTWRVIELRFASNAMVGVLPDEIGLLEHLQVLQLTFNRGLSGKLPESIGMLSRLERLYAWNTSLTAIPDSIGGLSNLIAIDLTDNLIEGPVPVGVANLENVDTVYLDGNAGVVCPLAAPVSKWLSAVKYHADPCARTSPSA